MGWEAFDTAPRPRSAVTLGSHRFGKKNQRLMLVLSVPSHLGPWGTAEFCSIMRGTDDEAGKLAFIADDDGAYKIKQAKVQFTVRFVVPIGSACQEHSAEVVRHILTVVADKKAVIVELPVWAMEAARKPLEPVKDEEAEPEADSRKAIGYTKPEEAKPAPSPAPEAVNALAKAILATNKPEPAKRLPPLPSPAEKPIANSKAKDWSPGRDPAPSIEDRMPPQRDHRRTQPIGDTMAQINRQTEAARRLPESKLSKTEIPPAWRGRADTAPEIARTGKADISLAGGYLMLGRTPVTVPKHLRPAMALLIDRFGEAVPLEAIGAVSQKKVVLEEIRPLIAGKFTLIVDGRQCMLTEA